MSKGIFDGLFKKKDQVCCDLQIEESVEESKPATCDCGGACGAASVSGDTSTERTLVKVLGPGCKKCHQLYDNVQEAALMMEKTVDVRYVTDMEEIAAAGIMSTPALMVNGEVVSTGKVLSPTALQNLI